MGQGFFDQQQVYCMSKKSRPILYSKLIKKIGQDFSDTQYYILFYSKESNNVIFNAIQQTENLWLADWLKDSHDTARLTEGPIGRLA